MAGADKSMELMEQLCSDGVIRGNVCIKRGQMLILAPGATQLSPPKPGWQPTNAGTSVCFQDCGIAPPPTAKP
jgi:hypothetical protein